MKLHGLGKWLFIRWENDRHITIEIVVYTCMVTVKHDKLVIIST